MRVTNGYSIDKSKLISFYIKYEKIKSILINQLIIKFK